MKTRKQYLAISLCLCGGMLMLEACDRKSDLNPVANIRELSKDRALQSSKYQTDCAVRPLTAAVTALFSKNSLKSSRYQYSFDGDNVTLTTLMYPTADCTGESAFTFDERGTFSIQDPKTAEGAKFIDINYKTVGVKVNSDDGARIANDLKLCGTQDWHNNSQADVTGNSKETTCYGTAVPRSDFNIYRIDGSVLYFGSTEGNANPATRQNQKLEMGQKYTAVK